MLFKIGLAAKMTGALPFENIPWCNSPELEIGDFSSISFI